MQDWDDFIRGVKPIKKKKIHFDRISVSEYKALLKNDLRKNPQNFSEKYEDEYEYVNDVVSVDLHGFTISEAEEMVKSTIKIMYESGNRNLHFITGRGNRGGDNCNANFDRRSIKGELCGWIDEPEIAQYIIKSYDDVKSKGGAIFIMLKRKGKAKISIRSY